MRYFFHFREKNGFVADEEGLELDGDQDAFAAARAGARSLIASEVLKGHLPLATVVEVVDGDGNHILDLPFRDVVELDG